MDFRETLEWCQTFNGHSSLQVFKLVCEDTVEDSLSIQALQKNLGMGLTRYSSHHNNQNMISVPQNDQQSSSAAAMNSMLSLQQQGSNSEPICKIKRHALEALFNTHFAGDNGVLSGKNVRYFLIIVFMKTKIDIKIHISLLLKNTNEIELKSYFFKPVSKQFDYILSYQLFCVKKEKYCDIEMFHYIKKSDFKRFFTSS